MGGRPQKLSANENLGPSRDDYRNRFRDIRARSAALAAPLGAEDQCIQSMPDVSPTKWHLAHTSWFFETFLLKPFGAGYGEFHPGYDYLFNSYYEAVGPRHERAKRGVLSRPPLEDIRAYRRHVEDAMERLFDGADDETWNKITPLIDLGLNHEQQHQELILTDIKHVFSCNPLAPAYQAYKPPRTDRGIEDVTPPEWIEFPEGLIETGFDGPGFAFDNEGPRHKVWLNGFRIAPQPVTNAEFLEFIGDGGYGCPEWWLSEGWAAVQADGWEAPLYWRQDGEDWQIMTLAGMRALDRAEPVCHVSYFEADAYANWAGKRLPAEAEWELLAADYPIEGNFAATGHFHPIPGRAGEGQGEGQGENRAAQVFGDVWEWTRSAYAAYPGYKAAAGAVGEYNAKFMSGQMVLKGGSAATPEGHIRASYRNFFYPPDRWQFSGLRLAEDA